MVDDPGRGQGGEQSFKHVQDEDECKEFTAEQAADVSCADISTSGRAGIDASGSGDDEAKGDGAGKVSGGDNRQQDPVSLRHAWRVVAIARRRHLYAISAAAA